MTEGFGGPQRRPSLLDYARQILAIACFYIGGVGITIVALLVPATRRPGRQYWQQARRRLVRVLQAFFDRLQKAKLLLIEDHTSEGPALPAGTLLVSNHPGLFDALLILCRWPDSSCVMRAGLMRHAAFQGAARACGFLPNDVGVDFVREAVARLRQGENLIIFPEGTRTLYGGPLLPFKRGFALVARKSGAPIQTLLLEHRGDFLRKGGKLWRPSWLPLQIRLRRGRFFGSEEVRCSASTEELAKRVEDYFHHALPTGGFAP